MPPHLCVDGAPLDKVHSALEDGAALAGDELGKRAREEAAVAEPEAAVPARCVRCVRCEQRACREHTHKFSYPCPLSILYVCDWVHVCEHGTYIEFAVSLRACCRMLSCCLVVGSRTDAIRFFT